MPPGAQGLGAGAEVSVDGVGVTSDPVLLPLKALLISSQHYAAFNNFNMKKTVLYCHNWGCNTH